MKYFEKVIFLIVLIGIMAVVFSDAQTKLRTVDKFAPMKGEPEPVTIINTAIGTKSLDSSKRAEGNDDWLKNLSFEVKNTASKNIEYIELTLLVEPQGKMDFYRAITASYGPRLSPRELGKPEDHATTDGKLFKPGETIVIRLSESDVDRFKKDLLKSDIDDLDRVRFFISWIRFDDGTAWANGAIFLHDKDNPGNWYVRGSQPPSKTLNK